MEQVITSEREAKRGAAFTHYAHTGWQLLSATVAVVAGFSTLNMTLADSGLAVLNEHAAPLFTVFTRLTRQG